VGPRRGRTLGTMTTITDSGPIADVLATTWMISSDSHIIEPPDIWDGLAAELGERAPRVVSADDGDWWYVDGKKTMSFIGIQAGDRFVKEADELRTSATFDDVRPAAYDPAKYLEENERDGIWGSVIYPSQGLVLFSVPVTDVVTLSMRAYNDWVADFCSEDTSRLKGIAMINLDEPDDAAEELTRCRALGLCGALVTVAPPSWLPFSHPDYDRFWATASDLDMPLSMHTATDRGDPRIGDAAFKLDVKHVPPSVFVNQDFAVRLALADLVFTGVFERFPNLRVGSVEHELSWIPYFLDRMDYTYTDRPPRGPWHRFPAGVLPSDYFHSNCFASFQEDAVGIRERDVIGVEALMWGSDYPHTESTFPRSQEILADILRDTSPAEARMIVSENAAKLYHFEPPARVDERTV
jgi:predicted TIM-barrel fold metal-dependent hydrolase